MWSTKTRYWKSHKFSIVLAPTPKPLENLVARLQLPKLSATLTTPNSKNVAKHNWGGEKNCWFYSVKLRKTWIYKLRPPPTGNSSRLWVKKGATATLGEPETDAILVWRFYDWWAEQDFWISVTSETGSLHRSQHLSWNSIWKIESVKWTCVKYNKRKNIEEEQKNWYIINGNCRNQFWELFQDVGEECHRWVKSASIIQSYDNQHWYKVNRSTKCINTY